MNEDWGFGPRPDGTLKGPGFDAAVANDGSYVTEFSAGDPNSLMFYPLMYEGIVPEQRELVRQAASGQVDPWGMRDVQGQALLAAMSRALRGLPLFYDTRFDGQPKFPVMGTFGFQE